MAIKDMLKQRCEILQNTNTTKNRYNVVTEDLAVMASDIRCYIQQVRGQEVTTPQGTVVVADYKIFLLQGTDKNGNRLDGGATESSYIRRNGQLYDIKSMVDVGEKIWRCNAARVNPDTV
jgi:hypothetical protein